MPILHSSRYLNDLIGLALLGSLLTWLGRAPSDPLAHARYLCRPVHQAVRFTQTLQATLADGSSIVAPQPAVSPDQNCEQLALVLLQTGRD